VKEKIESPAKVETQIDDDSYTPIKALDTFNRDWTIKARVSAHIFKKTQKGGDLLKIELIDTLGTCIEATFFNEAAKIFAPMIKKDRVYSF
jgi:hypothetical protein